MSSTEDEKPRPETDPTSLYVLAVGVVGQVGCFLTIVIGAAVLLGLFLDRQFDSEPTFLFIFLLGSIPFNLWAIYKYTQMKAKSLQVSSSRREDTISDD